MRKNKKRLKRLGKRRADAGLLSTTPSPSLPFSDRQHPYIGTDDSALGGSDQDWDSPEDSIVQQCRKVSANAKRSSRSPDSSSEDEDEFVDVNVSSDSEGEAAAKVGGQGKGRTKRRKGKAKELDDGGQDNAGKKRSTKIKYCK